MTTTRPGALPARAGLGLKAEHVREILETRPRIGFLEVHAENYMGAGGPPHRALAVLAGRYPLSLHGVGLSIGSDHPLDREHLDRLRHLLSRYDWAMFSEHLAWSSHDTGFLNDLLPLPYTGATLARVTDHIDEVQLTLGRRMLLENPASYLQFAESTWSEPDFIAEIARRTGCGLLLDVNNVHVACVNRGDDPYAWLDALPLDTVGEIHLAGHRPDHDDAGRTLLIDTHDRAVAEPVWALYRHALRRTGPVPTLVEWDADVPDLATLRAQADRAERLIAATALAAA